LVNCVDFNEICNSKCWGENLPGDFLTCPYFAGILLPYIKSSHGSTMKKERWLANSWTKKNALTVNNNIKKEKKKILRSKR
jgi:hypothetical protein